MTTTSSTTSPAPAQQARRLATLRGASLGALVMLIVQFGLGVGVNLYVSLPAAGSGGRKVSQAFSNGPLLVLHVAVGLLLIVAAISLLVRAIVARHVPVIVASAVGLLAIIFAATQGFSFVHDSTNAASMAMATATGVAMFCYAIALFLVRPSS
ncbi:MAG TPA: hypothetical protein VKS82_16495 [Streptosporangiaceae bacterium]|nr:hypothetical protein [Streptosporangiaceae bacterium]